MKRFIATVLALVCLLSLVGCELNPAGNTEPGSNDGSSSGSSGNSGSSQTVIPGGDDMLNEDGTLKLPAPDADAKCTVDAATWQSLLSEDAILAAMRENSLTTLTSGSDKSQYQMFYCAGGRYGSILKGNMYSETICGTQDGTVYIFSRSSADGTWTRRTSSESYETYVDNQYCGGAIRYLGGIAEAYADARYVEADKVYVIENHQIPLGEDQNLEGTLKIQLVDDKLYSITLYLNANGESGTLSAVFGSVPGFDLPTDFQVGDSTNNSTSTSGPNHDEPPEASCTQQRWERLFSNDRILDTLSDSELAVELTNGNQKYYYRFSSRDFYLLLSTGSTYQEIILNPEERFQRDSENGQWLRYGGISHHTQYDSILSDKTAVLRQLLTPLADLYNQTSFDSPRSCFSLDNVSFSHDTFGSVSAEYDIIIRGGILEEIKAVVQSDAGTWELTLERDKSNRIELPTDYVDMENDKESGRPSKK